MFNFIMRFPTLLILILFYPMLIRAVPEQERLPTKADAVRVLKKVQDISKKRLLWQDQATHVAYEMAILRARSLPVEQRLPYLHYTLLFHRSPEWTGKHYMGMAAEQLQSILTLATPLPDAGSWKPAKELSGQESVRRWASYHQVNEAACYGFSDPGGDRLLMYWDGKKLSILCVESEEFKQKFRTVTNEVSDQSEAAALQAYVIGNMGPYAAPAIPFYRAQLESKEFYTRLLAASTLWKIDRRKEVSLPVLSQAFLQAVDPKEKRNAAVFLSEMGPAAKPWNKELMAYFDDADPSIQIAMAYGLWRIDPGLDEPKAVVCEIIVNTANSLYLRKQACKIMGRIAPPELMQILQERLNAPDESDKFKRAAQKMVNPNGF